MDSERVVTSVIINHKPELVVKDEHKEDIGLFFYNLGRNTHEAYSFDLKLFFKFLDLKQLSLYRVRQVHIEEFMKFVSGSSGINQKPCSDRTYNRKLSALKSFFRYLCEKRILDSDPCSFVRLRKIPLVVETDFIAKDKIRELLKLIPSDTLRHKRDRAGMAILFYTGCRVSELLKLRLKDYSFYAHGRKILFSTKGNGVREVPVPLELEEIINDYLQELISTLGYSLEDYLFTNLKKNTCLYRSSFNDIFKKWVRKLKLSYTTSPHSARTSFIVMMDENNVDVKKQAETVGHSNVAMTIAYNKKRESLEKNPVLDIKLL